MSDSSSAYNLDYPFSNAKVPDHTEVDRARKKLLETLSYLEAINKIASQDEYQSQVDLLAQDLAAIETVAQESTASLALMLSLWKAHAPLVDLATTATGTEAGTSKVVKDQIRPLSETLTMSEGVRDTLRGAHLQTRRYLFSQDNVAEIRDRGALMILPAAFATVNMLDGRKPDSIVDIAKTISSLVQFPSKMYALQAQRFRRRKAAASLLSEVESILDRTDPKHFDALEIIDTVTRYERAVAFAGMKPWMTGAGAAVKFESLFGWSSVVTVSDEMVSKGEYVKPISEISQRQVSEHCEL